MTTVDYFAIIHKYIEPTSLTYRYYLPHVSLVTAKALKIGHRLGLPAEQLRFIEEAAMLHDIGIVKVDEKILGCAGSLPYVCHLTEGRAILEAEGLPKHALVAERHVGVGLTQAEIRAQQLPLPARDLLPETVEEKIISWADLFYGKSTGRLWLEKPVDEVRKKIARYGERHLQVFDEWRAAFGD